MLKYDIIFEWTDNSRAMAQGSGPSGQAGYNIWIQYTDDDYVDFLGFITQDQFYDEIEYFKSVGITPKMRGKSE